MFQYQLLQRHSEIADRAETDEAFRCHSYSKGKEWSRCMFNIRLCALLSLLSTCLLQGRHIIELGKSCAMAVHCKRTVPT
jgi:hypothetical protein